VPDLVVNDLAVNLCTALLVVDLAVFLTFFEIITAFGVKGAVVSLTNS
jgi:hypothetical protein